MVGMTGQQKGGIVDQGCKKQLGSCFKKENVDFGLDGSLMDRWLKFFMRVIFIKNSTFLPFCTFSFFDARHFHFLFLFLY
jgi:hypothetical protein